MAESAPLRSENTVMVLQLGSAEYAIDVSDEFKDVHVYVRRGDGAKLKSFTSPFGESFTDDAGKAEALAGALTEIARITRKEQEES